MSNTLVKLFGHRAAYFHGDTLVFDRWRWIRRRLPPTRDGLSLLDVGCGAGAFALGAARRGYEALGLTWDAADNAKATERASLCGIEAARFSVCDVRRLDGRGDLVGRFDYVVCAENIEHILDDLKLMRDIAACLKPGGRLLLTTPNYYNISITPTDDGPYCRTETGWHVRRGYSEAMLRELCQATGLHVEEVSSTSGFFSQLVTRLMRAMSPISHYGAWLAIAPLRLLPLLDPIFRHVTGWPDYSICLVAYKPRFGKIPVAQRQLPANVASG
jgi:2-polyprenyl-3-methyl-5-hydroxy-6-metoxy-1,4-benzoquinol methylase